MIFIKFKKYIVVALAVLCLVVVSIVPAFAASYNRNKVIESIQNNDKVKEVTEGKNYFAVVLHGARTFVNVYVTGGQYLVSSNNSIDIPNSDCHLYRFYVLDDSTIEFSELVRTFSDYSVTVTNSNDMSDSALLVSSYDLKTTEGTVFFQKPQELLERLLSLVPAGLGERVAADSLTLTICGISLIALLIGCALVPKVLYRFL